nr:unnamed protein product [Callosobruchus analis]
MTKQMSKMTQGRKRCMLLRRGTKYPERICNFTKSATTTMMCGSASAVLLPPYIIYKSERMWLQRTKSGLTAAFKTAWRSTLLKWKHDHSCSTTVDRKGFPHVLDNTLNEIDKTSDDGSSVIHRDVISSFRATGVLPLDPERVLHRLLDIPNVDENVVYNVLVNYLQEKRFGRSITGPESSSDVEEETAAVLEESSDDAVSVQLEEETEYFSVENDNLTIGAYLLVNVVGGSGKKTMFRSVAIIQNATDDGIEVTGMKSVESTKTRLKAVENDIFMINASEVVAVIPNPDTVDIGRQNICMSEKNLDIKEI